MRRFTYRGWARVRVLWLEIGGMATLIFFPGVGVLLIIAAVLTRSPMSGPVFIGAWAVGIGLLVGLSLINHYPTIWLGDDGLELGTPLMKHFKVQWENVIDVRPVRWSLAGDTLVRARHISLVHRLYGWMYSHTLFPSFVIGRDIERRDELLAEIQQHVASGSGVS